MANFRWLLSLLALVLVVAPKAEAVQISLPEVTAAPGERVRVPVQIDGLAGEAVLSGNLDIRFDGQLVVVDATSVDRKGSLAARWIVAANARLVPDDPDGAGQVLIGMATASDQIVEPGIFFFLDLLVAESAPIGSSTSLHIESILLNNGSPTAITRDGLLTVSLAELRADFTGAPLEGVAPLEVQLQERSSEEAETFFWEFGDGQTSSQRNPRHVYDQAGDFAVSLTVTGEGGHATETKENYIHVDPDQRPPDIIEGPIALGTTHNATTLFWKTNEPGSSQVQYCKLGLRPQWGSLDELIEALREELVEGGEVDEEEERGDDEDCEGCEVVRQWLLRGELPHFKEDALARWPLIVRCDQVIKEELLLDHDIRISGMTPFTFYLYRVRSADDDGNYSVWKGGFFVTRARPDEEPPRIILGPRATPAQNRALLTWETDEPGNSFVQYGLDEEFRGDYRLLISELAHRHEVWLEDLEENTTYYYRVRSSDASGNGSPLKRGHFRTTGSDLIPPVIWNGPRTTFRTPSKALIEWATDEPSTSRVEFGMGEEYGRFAASDHLLQNHKVLLTHLETQTLYHYRVVSVDVNGNRTASEDQTFVTRVLPDTRPCGIVRAPYVIKRFHDRVIIGWGLDEVGRGHIEFGRTEDYGQMVEISEFKREHAITLTGLAPGTDYHCRIQVVDLEGNGPTISRNLKFWTASRRDDEAPIIEAQPIIRERTDTQVTIAWKTDEAADGFVEFGVSDDYDRIAGSVDLVLEHQVRLTGLQPSATYHFRVSSTDAAGNGPATSADFTFSTRPTPDEEAPVILAGPAIVALSEKSAVVEWQTSESTDGFVDYGTEITYGEEAFSDLFGRVHRVRLTNLEPGVTYHFRVSSTDATGNGPTGSRDLTFTTEAGQDRNPPRIWGVSVRKVTSSSSLIEWWTSRPADSFADFGATTDYGQRLESPDFVRHHQKRISGLTANTLYQFRVGSRDISGNEATSQNLSFRTAAESDGIPPVVVRGPEVVTSHATATFIWRTDEPCFASVVVGTQSTMGTPAERLFESLQAEEEHSLTVTGLERGTRYLFALLSRDLSGNETIIGERRRRAGKIVRPLMLGDEISFVTAAEPDFAAPTIVDGPRLVAQTDSEGLIEWTTDEIGDSRLFLEKNGQLVLTEFIPEHDFEHQVLLTDLQPATTYRVRVASADPAGNGPTQSPFFIFTTSARADATPPRLLGTPSLIEVGDRVATIAWETDEASSSEVLFGVDALEQTQGDPTLTTRHRVELTGLEPGTAYRFQVRSYDAQENGPAQSETLSFSTASGPDIQAPIISAAPIAELVTDRSAVIAWETDEAADGFVHFGGQTDLDQVVGRAELGTQHRVLLAHLEPSTTYRFKVTSADRAGNGPTESELLTLTTAAQPDEVAPPAPTDLAARDAGAGQIALTWEPAADDDVAGYNVYRAQTADFQRIAGPLAQTSYRDQGLSADGDYRYRIAAVDQAGNEGGASAEVEVTAVALRPGDFQGDGQVGFDDFFLLVERFGRQEGTPGFGAEYDLNDDGQIGFDDFFLFVDLFGTSYKASRPPVARVAPAIFQPQLRVEPGRRSGEVVLEVRARAHRPLRGYGLRLEYETEGARFAGTATDEADFFAGNSGFFGVLTDRPGELSLGGYLPAGEPFSGEGSLVRLVFQTVPGAPPARVRLQEAVGIDDDADFLSVALPTAVQASLAPVSFVLEQNFPNPFNPQTEIRFQLPQTGLVSLRIYDVLGQEIAVLVDRELPAGYHRTAWNGRDRAGNSVGSGIYLYLMEAGDYHQARKLLLLR